MGEVLAGAPDDGGAADRTSPFSRLPVSGITGNCASFPFSNRSRHSGSTEAGSRSHSSYITWTKAALWVPKTNSLTGWNLTYLMRQNVFALAHADRTADPSSQFLSQRPNRGSHRGRPRARCRRLLSRPHDQRLAHARRRHAVP